MSSTIEDRLTAALGARAEQVTPQDLRPLEVPEPPGRFARPGVLLLAAAVTAAVVATPFVLTGDGGTSPAPGPAGTPSVVPSPSGSGSPEPTPTESPSDPGKVTAGLTVVGRQQADVDGDGRPDRVRLLTDATNPDDPGESGLVEVTLASGGTGVADVPGGYLDLLPAFDVGRDGRESVLVSHTEGGDAAQLLVYTWLDGSLAQATKEGDAPLSLELGGDGRLADYHTDDRGLVSWRRLDRVAGSTYRVEQWWWSLDGDRLVPKPAGKACLDVTTDEAPGPC